MLGGNGNIGRKMANGRLLFQALALYEIIFQGCNYAVGKIRIVGEVGIGNGSDSPSSLTTSYDCTLQSALVLLLKVFGIGAA